MIDITFKILYLAVGFYIGTILQAHFHIWDWLLG